jgi:nucleotide-binding universal stress UspA family protein
VADRPDEETVLAEAGFEWPRYPRILVAIDETPAAAFALRHVVPYAVDQRSQLTLLTVVPDPSAAVIAAGVSPQRLAEEMETEAETRLRRLAATLPRDLSVTSILRHGDPAEEILKLIDEQPVDLICMGARGRGRISGALLGSVSTAVLHHSPVPVVVLHPATESGTTGAEPPTPRNGSAAK